MVLTNLHPYRRPLALRVYNYGPEAKKAAPARKQAEWMPPVNVRKTEHEFVIEVAAPGRAKADFNVSLEKNVLEISSKTEAKEAVKDVKYTLREFDLRSFKRSFRLPDTLDFSALKATYKDGVLSVILPKRAETAEGGARAIAID